MRAVLPAFVAILLATEAGAVPPPPVPPPLLPMPKTVTVEGGALRLKGASIAASTPDEVAAARRLAELVAKAGGPLLALRAGGTIRFRHDAAVAGAEAYRLRVGSDGATITASTATGLYYGAETLSQLIAAAQNGAVPGIAIDDAPAFGWRGVMLDSARHFQPVGYVKQLIDRMAAAKLNTLHWHLADDEGWRLQIDRYPRLTAVGAWRQNAGAAAYDEQGRPVLYGGFYTKAEVRAVVAYAAQHHVTIVPEIDMPGHATAMVAAYPGLASISPAPSAPSPDWGILPNLLNPSNEGTFVFVEHVLDELLDLFPGRYIHIGGDEAVKDQWKANPAIQAQIKALGLKDEDALQSWFTARLGTYLSAHHRTLIGWDEILQGPLPADATITSWRGTEGALTAAKAGHDAVLAPAPVFYLDNRQSDAADEPPGRGETIDWKRLYDFDPVPAALTAEQRRHILGMQVNLWTERVRTTQYADRMIWPRAAVLAELGWAPRAAHDWFGFSWRLAGELARWDRMGWAYDATPLAPQLTVTAAGATLRQPAGIGTLRYDTSGAATPHSPEAAGPVALAGVASLSAQAFLGERPIGPRRSWPASALDGRSRLAADMQLCSSGIPIRMEDDAPTNGERRVLYADIMRPCWIWKDAPLDGVAAIRAEVGQVPFNVADGTHGISTSFAKPQTPEGELIVQRGCDGPELARIPLAPVAANPGVSPLRAAIAGHGRADLCIRFAQYGPHPLWLLDRLTLETAK